jgi:hypothetical protein
MGYRAVIFSFFLFLVPLVFVYGAPIVPPPPSSGLGYRACDLLTLVNNVMKFLIYISAFIAVLLVAFAGFKSVIGGESAELGSLAVAIGGGILLMLSGWLIVDTVIKVFTGGRLGPWNSIQCVENYEISRTTFVPLSGTGGGGVIPGLAPQGRGNCSAEALTPVFGSQAATFSCIAQRESGCNPGLPSGVDVGADGNAVSFGLYQINISANRIVCDGQTYNCPAAFSSMYTAQNRSTTVVNPELYTQCRALATNASCNSQTAQSLYQRAGLSPWRAQNNRCF